MRVHACVVTWVRECGLNVHISTTPHKKTQNQHTNTQNSYIADLNANITSLPSLGPYSKYEVPEEKVRGRLEFSWIGEVRIDF